MTEPDEIRINARLTGEDARRFRELQKRGGLSASDLLRDALREYHDTHTKRADPAALLHSAGFVGGGEAPADLSTRYKDYLTAVLEEKTPLRVQEPRPRGHRR